LVQLDDRVITALSESDVGVGRSVMDWMVFETPVFSPKQHKARELICPTHYMIVSQRYIPFDQSMNAGLEPLKPAQENACNFGNLRYFIGVSAPPRNAQLSKISSWSIGKREDIAANAVDAQSKRVQDEKKKKAGTPCLRDPSPVFD
jgi:hypothetical protein